MRRIKEKHRRNAAMAHLLTFLVWRFSGQFMRVTWSRDPDLVVWIDVREHEEWRRKNLPGALLLPCSRHDTVALRAADANGALPRKRDTPLLVFCGEVRGRYHHAPRTVRCV